MCVYFMRFLVLCFGLAQPSQFIISLFTIGNVSAVIEAFIVVVFRKCFETH